MKINWFKINKLIIYDYDLFYNIVIDNNIIKFLTYLIQGYECKDCNRFYTGCSCNNFNETFNYDLWIIRNLSKFTYGELLNTISILNRARHKNYRISSSQYTKIYKKLEY